MVTMVVVLSAGLDDLKGLLIPPPLHIQHFSSPNVSRELAASAPLRSPQQGPVLLAGLPCPSLPTSRCNLVPRLKGRLRRDKSPDPIAMEMLIQAEFKGTCSS
ncbi:hypothetical protein DUI87_31548 [Hirundo rustica rustica]|uniref:Uncharacterized protein n=1 Tax=Hirundo rustica rustica TaxID=333673 RepID=A0A3M0IZT8_HIRRU|nr:hypothetical protein DUI87_31548 [Hirundo rustica rustica]